MGSCQTLCENCQMCPEGERSMWNATSAGLKPCDGCHPHPSLIRPLAAPGHSPPPPPSLSVGQIGCSIPSSFCNDSPELVALFRYKLLQVFFQATHESLLPSSLSPSPSLSDKVSLLAQADFKLMILLPDPLQCWD